MTQDEFFMKEAIRLSAQAVAALIQEFCAD